MSIRTFLVLLLSINAFASPPLQLESQRGLPYNDIKTLKNQNSRFRLPISVIPHHYNLQIIPILDSSLGEERKFSADGTVKILAECVTKSSVIVLHQENISIVKENVTVTDENNGAVINVSSIVLNDISSSLEINLSSDLAVGKNYTIEISFTSQVTNDEEMSGLYLSWYLNDAGKEVYHATTQFESTGARKAFPCFDEPYLRATFDVEVGRRNDTGYSSLSNTDLIETVPLNRPGFPANWVLDIYNKTVNMPTYLVAVIVSDFLSRDADPDLANYPVKTWAQPNLMVGDNANFSANAAAKILTFFEKYLGSNYQLSKLDSVAIPRFAAGAMENWGLNTYRVNLMIFEEGDSTQFEQWRQGAVIAHEVSHHWFGNLVTMAWWNDLWLKEGFARYLQFLGVDGAEPQLGAIDRYPVDTTQIAMENDIRTDAHALRGNWTADIQYQNSRIIYEKGAALIRMMQAFLTEKTLRSGLIKYLNKYSYGSAVQDQLFEELTSAAHEDGILPLDLKVHDIMNSWTLQPGFPILHVSKAGSSRIYISQEKYRANGGESKNVDEITTWEIPVTVQTKSDRFLIDYKPKLWIHQNEALTSTPVQSTDEWILVNPDARNYYRVQYDEHLFSMLKNQIVENYTVFTPSTRSQLIDDYFSFAFNSYETMDKALDLTKYLEKEDKIVVWTSLFVHLRRIYTYMNENESVESFKSYFRCKIEGPLLELENDLTPTGIMLRAQLLDWACSLGHPYCTSLSEKLMADWKENPEINPIKADFKPMIYCAGYGSQNSSLGLQDFITEKFENGKISARERGLLLNAMACGNNMTSLENALKMSIQMTNSLEIAERKTLLQKVAENSMGRDLIIPFFKANFQSILFNLRDDTFSTIIRTLSNYGSTESRISEFEDFINSYPDLVDSVKNSIRASIEIINSNIGWLNKHQPVIKKWLDENSCS